MIFRIISPRLTPLSSAGDLAGARLLDFVCRLYEQVKVVELASLMDDLHYDPGGAALDTRPNATRQIVTSSLMNGQQQCT